MKKTMNIFSHKGYVGATTDIENGKFINDIKLEGQLGVVVSVLDICITSEALNLLKSNTKKEGGSFSSFMLTRSENPEYTNSIATMGFGIHLLKDAKEPLYIGRECDLTVLDDIYIDDEMIVPDGFIEHVESLLINK